jgi:protein gp37
VGDTKITWAQKVWNPVRGCSPVSSGCKFCYAARFAHRFSAEGQRYEGLTRFTEHGPVWTGDVRLVPEFLSYPLRWTRPRRVFVNSMSDLFHPKVPNDFIAAVFGVMAVCRRHTFQILTKRPERLAEWFAWVQEKMKGRHINPALGHHAAAMVDTFSEKEADRIYKAINKMGFGRLSEWPLPNVWLGVSVEDQKAADERIPKLLAAPAAVHWVSMEPMIGPVDLSTWYLPCPHKGNEEKCSPCWASHQDAEPYCTRGTFVDWVVLGGESGPKARPMDPAWVCSVQKQCQAAGVPFLFKQWGEWGPVDRELTTQHVEAIHHEPGSRETRIVDDQGLKHTYYRLEEGWMEWVGKHAAGRELDGKIWDEYPQS